ncbi:MAG: glutamate-5-semialdehyde dehydrogenase, partial [Clostridia bacterium]|nr:glutamate-5-semialdehyde dehydrogenase [Clostridia bacterium]
MTTSEILKRAKKCKQALATASGALKNKVLELMAECLLEDEKKILAANAQDVEAAKGVISDVMIDRLTLNSARIKGMADGILALIDLKNPVGEVLSQTEKKNGMLIEKVAVPLGVVAIIYESRPNVTSDAAALCLKSGNVCVLRSGKEAWKSAKAIVDALQRGVLSAGLPPECIQLVEDITRQSATDLMTANGYVDLLIPRGGAGLINACLENATVPCIQTGTGICHVYVDEFADFDKALNIINNAKTSRPSVCNAEEVCLVHQAIAPTFLPLLKQKLVDDRISEGKQPVELRLDKTAQQYIEGKPAQKKDFDTEFLDYILAVAVVDDVEQAVKHISLHSTQHSEAIVTEDKNNAEIFVNGVD